MPKPMPTKDDLAAAGARYRAAVLELRQAWGELAAIERVTFPATGGRFGAPPDVVSLRHPEFADDMHGSFADDMHAVLQRNGW
jgi:hypothetical protein